MASKNRSGFMFMFVILLLLGVIVYTYRDKFYVLFNTGYTSGKDYVEKKFDKKDNEKMITEKIDLLERIKEGRKLKEKIDDIKDNIRDIKEKVATGDDYDNKKEEVTVEVIKDHEDERKEFPVKEKMIKVEKVIERVVKENIINNKNNNMGEEEVTFNHRTGKLYFSKIIEDGNMRLVSVDRTITYINTPLTETLKSLLDGPSEFERSTEVISNIPNKTKLLSVYIKNNTAFINLSGEFEHNSYGRESTIAQIKQVVFTATEFTNVKYVQFLINGEIKKYLGGEGITINKPYSRNDFS